MKKLHKDGEFFSVNGSGKWSLKVEIFGTG